MKLTFEDAQIVARAVERLEVPGQHIQTALAATVPASRYDEVGGVDCDPNDPAAVSWCAIGALKKEGASEELIEKISHFVVTGKLPEGEEDTCDEEGIYELNDDRNGRSRIRRKLRSLVHAIVKLENKK